MPEVFGDTSPIQYLHQTASLDLLPALYSKLVVARAVAEEIAVGRSLGVPLPDLQSLPWIEMREVANRQPLRFSPDLDLGEKETLALALESSDPLVILDDGLARRHAKLLEIPCTGTIGVLLKAKEKSLLLRIQPIIDQLAGLGFRLSPATRKAALDLAGE